MCSTSTLVPIPAWYPIERFDPTHPEFGLDAAGTKCFAIDSCIVPALEAVWAAGFKTLGCCCGHGQGRGVITIGEYEDDPTAYNTDHKHHCSYCGQEHITWVNQGAKEGEAP